MMENDKEVLLMTVNSDMEARMIEAELNAFGVPVFKKFRGLDAIYGNVSFTGVEIYVPSHLLENAKDILNNKTT